MQSDFKDPTRPKIWPEEESDSILNDMYLQFKLISLVKELTNYRVIPIESNILEILFLIGL